MRKLAITTITMAAACALSLQAQSSYQGQSSQSSQGSQSSQPSQSQSSQDTSFIQKAAQGNLAEVQLGKLGAQKSQNDQIKQLSQHLQTDHQKANDQLRPLAQSKGVQFPQTLDSKHQKEINKLEKLSGAEFDKQFATMAVKDHAKTISLFQKEAQQGQDQATKQYAQSLLPALQHHLDMAKTTAKSVGVSDTQISSILKQYPGAMGGTGTPTGQEQGTGSSDKHDQMHMHDMK